ncbi:hypothetical protein CC1G_11008 [Coprinopsis cinerea okayama7|uniref:F-box domain-containing protein n=1 Tax=Coprinopsis cinerea (strain Okayama-7 / 130 / ATCC MYA-4618 / FGSC 9003) TaxID=240176 RepID=A8P739_COPC7|nr:hypothetical protein CC1G_11008 [Coprinopsis cinerea okayama7\|eukprot:XP_001839286.1 hypothetical protein CC1G_11008 [Coprinopsis cinerea okayama7\
MSPLLKLPLELKLHICLYLDAEAIVAIRQTCKELYTLEKSFYDTIWTNCVDRLCEAHELFAPTFKWRPMSPKGREAIARRIDMMEPILEKAWQGPSDSDHCQAPPPSDAVDLLSRVDNPDEDISFEFIELLPGGRILLLFSANFLYVWDLAPYLDHLATPIERRVLLPWNYAPDTLVLPALGPDKTSVRFMITLEPFHGELQPLYAGWDVERLRIFQVMELCFVDDGDLHLGKIGRTLPVFYPFSEMDADFDEGYLKDREVTEDYVLFRIRRRILAWSFKESTYAVWDLVGSGGDSERIRFQISMAGDSVLVFEDGELTVYEMPPLIPVPAGGQVVDFTQLGPTPIARRISVPLPKHSLVCDGKCEAWRGSAGYLTPPYYYVHHIDVAKACAKTAWYRVDVDFSSSPPVQVTELEWDVSRDLDGKERIWAFNRPFKGKLVATSVWGLPLQPDGEGVMQSLGGPQSASVYIAVTAPSTSEELSSQPPESKSPTTVTKGSGLPVPPRESTLFHMADVQDIDGDWDHEVNCDFCPLSGILVVTSRRYRGSQVLPAKRIQVFDFVRPRLR